MSLLKINTQVDSPATQLVEGLNRMVTEGGAEFSNARTTKSLIGLESLNEADLHEVNQSAVSVADQIREQFESVLGSDMGVEALNDVQLEAATMAALAAGNPLQYAKAAMESRAHSGDGVALVGYQNAGVGGNLDYRDDVASLEAFDEQQLANMIPYSIAFNAQASRQDEFSEAFYKTVVVSPEKGGLDISVDRVTVFNAVRRSVKGVATDFNQRNLVEAVADASILADESTAVVPHLREDNSNASVFLSDEKYVSYRDVGGVEVKTAPLRVDQEVDILGLSSHPGLLNAGILDHTDALDARMFLQKLYIQRGDNEVYTFNVSRLPRNGFLKSIEGADREMTLNFISDALTLNGDTRAADSSTPTIIQTIGDADYTVRLSVKVTGDANVEFGSVSIGAMPVKVAGIEDADGNTVSMTTGAGATIKQNLEGLRIIGYDLGASRTNSNRRTRGLLLNNNRETERFAIPLGSPISVPSPIGSNRDTRDLESLVTAARIRNSNNAVTTLLNYADTLRAFVQNRRLGHGTPVIEGVGRHVVVPFFEESDLHLNDVINSIKSKDRAEDISAVLVNKIRDVVYRMYRDTGIQTALDTSSWGGKKPTLLVGTDSIIQRHLMISGDNRTFGIAFENHKIVTSFDSRIDNKIFLTFTREGSEGRPDPLSFGTHAWIPELTSSIMVQRDGATYQEAMVQPRSRHINNLPILAVINVHGMEDVLTDKVAVDVNNTGDTGDTGAEDGSGTVDP